MEDFEGYEPVVSGLWAGDLDEVEAKVYHEVWFRGKTPDTVDCSDTTPEEIRQFIIPSIIEKARLSHNPGWPRKDNEQLFNGYLQESGYSRSGDIAPLEFSDHAPPRYNPKDSDTSECWAKGSPHVYNILDNTSVGGIKGSELVTVASVRGTGKSLLGDTNGMV